jgi:hypothetical protein
VRRNSRTALWITGVTIAVAPVVLLIVDWKPYSKHYQAFAPIFALVAGLAIAGVTLMRHFAQTEADRQRRITESFSKAIEQLGSDKIAVHLGGIYTLERISRESADDYWTVMETLCAFVRERAHWKAPEEASSEKANATADLIAPPTDIAAVLAVIVRRDEKSRQRESGEGWRLDFGHADLRGAALVHGAVGIGCRPTRVG